MISKAARSAPTRYVPPKNRPPSYLSFSFSLSLSLSFSGPLPLCPCHCRGDLTNHNLAGRDTSTSLQNQHSHTYDCFSDEQPDDPLTAHRPWPFQTGSGNATTVESQNSVRLTITPSGNPHSHRHFPRLRHIANGPRSVRSLILLAVSLVSHLLPTEFYPRLVLPSPS